MRKKISYDDLVKDYKNRFGVDNPGRIIKVLHREEIERLHIHPSDEELRIRRKFAKKELCI